jgi:hypothetical protein
MTEVAINTTSGFTVDFADFAIAIPRKTDAQGWRHIPYKSVSPNQQPSCSLVTRRGESQ